MNLCTCGHDEQAHANGTGYCYADKRNGEPCDCERFTLDPAVPAAEPGQLAGSQYIGEEERKLVENEIYRIVVLATRFTGILPEAFVFGVCNHERGEQRQIVFELILDAWPWAPHQRSFHYRATGSFEFAGVPDQAWTVPL